MGDSPRRRGSPQRDVTDTADQIDDLRNRTSVMFGQLANLAEIVEDLASSVRSNTEIVRDSEATLESAVSAACERMNDVIVEMGVELRHDMETRDRALKREISDLRAAVSDLYRSKESNNVHANAPAVPGVSSSGRRDSPRMDSPRGLMKDLQNGERVTLSPNHRASTSPQALRAAGGSPRDHPRSSPHFDGAVADVLKHFEDTVATVFVQYSSWSAKGGGTQLMSRSDFVKFVKDCNIPQKTNQAIADLVFLKITIGSVDVSSSRQPEEEAAHEFDIVEFRQALVMLANAVYAARETLTSAQKLREFLVNGVQVVASHNEDMRYPDPRVKNSKVSMVMSAYRKQVRKIYDHYAATIYERRTGPRKVSKMMTSEDFIDMLREYGLSPIVSNGFAKDMFNLALKRKLRHELAKQGESSTKKHIEPEISFEEFYDLIATLALEIYGADMYSQAYPNPEDKVQKLLVKLVVLQSPASQSVRGSRVRRPLQTS